MLYDSTYHPIFVDQKNTAMETLHSISIASETGPLALYDGRNRAQNGWFILRTLIPSDKTEGAVVWHIGPNVIPNWTRPPMVAHSEVGYPSSAPKIAVIELDPKFDAPKTAKVLRLAEDGFYKPVFEGPISSSTPWLRYTYAKFDFSAVKDPGLYVIEYAGQRTALFPIAPDVYSRTWQSSLDGFLAVEMDHVSVREGYRLWWQVASRGRAAGGERGGGAILQTRLLGSEGPTVIWNAAEISIHLVRAEFLGIDSSIGL